MSHLDRRTLLKAGAAGPVGSWSAAPWAASPRPVRRSQRQVLAQRARHPVGADLPAQRQRTGGRARQRRSCTRSPASGGKRVDRPGRQRATERRGRPARPGAAPGLPTQPLALRLHHHRQRQPGRADAVRRRPAQQPAPRAGGHPPEHHPQRRPAALRADRAPLRRHRRRRQHQQRPGPGLAGRQDPAVTDTGEVPGRQPVRRQPGVDVRAPQRAGPLLRQPRAGCGPPSSARTPATSSTGSSRGHNYGWPVVEGGDGAGGDYHDPLVDLAAHVDVLTVRAGRRRAARLGRRAGRRVALPGRRCAAAGAAASVASSRARSAGSAPWRSRRTDPCGSPRPTGPATGSSGSSAVEVTRPVRPSRRARRRALPRADRHDRNPRAGLAHPGRRRHRGAADRRRSGVSALRRAGRRQSRPDDRRRTPLSGRPRLGAAAGLVVRAAIVLAIGLLPRLAPDHDRGDPGLLRRCCSCSASPSSGSVRAASACSRSAGASRPPSSPTFCGRGCRRTSYDSPTLGGLLADPTGVLTELLLTGYYPACRG